MPSSAFENLPDRIGRLGELAYNLWWSWTPQARALFKRLDLSLWRSTHHNPVAMLRRISAQRLERQSEQDSFLELYDRVMERLDRYMSRQGWFERTYPEHSDCKIAYFCAEFGLHSSLPVYSGGLGLLAGDTCKEASDLGIPLVGIGCLYPEGYFRQRIEPDGRQEAFYVRLDTDDAPLQQLVNPDGSRLLFPIPVADRQVFVAVWKVQAGRTPIFLMDTCIEENSPWDRDVSARLYGGDQSVRLRQEIILGMGGLQVLQALGHSPTLLHLNEGHAAFAILELLSQLRHEGLGFDEALQEVRRRTVFTTHTPVKAGHDEFAFSMLEEFFRSLWRDLGISRERFLDLGTAPQEETFGMTVLALRASGHANGVSRRHGEVSRQMWSPLWPDKPVEDVPIRSITNGVHLPTWLSPELDALLRRYLGDDWLEKHDDPDTWAPAEGIPAQELWEVHRRLKGKLLRVVREKARNRWKDDGLSAGQLAAFGSLLDPDVLTVGFARRFATYKRGNLLLRDRDRLRRILLDSDRPAQFIFAGKAHPADEPGKFLLQEVFQACMDPTTAGRLAFIEEYDKHIGYLMVQGVDVWLNNPRPPLEASGTSGQKAALNGVVNCSVMDGWWCEGYNQRNGWAVDETTGADDQATATALYDLLENHIAPLYYDTDSSGVPQGWTAMMKESIRSLAAPFSARRMVKEYLEKMYLAEEREPAKER